MLEFLKQNWHYILTACQTALGICLTIVLMVKNRKLKLLQIAEHAVEEAEQLGGTAEQKKKFAVAIIKQDINASDSVIDKLIERFIDFSKNVNAKKNKSISEVLNNEVKS